MTEPDYFECRESQLSVETRKSQRSGVLWKRLGQVGGVCFDWFSIGDSVGISFKDLQVSRQIQSNKG